MTDAAQTSPAAPRRLGRFELSARGTHFCSWCQRLPSADRTASNLSLVRSSRRSARRGRNWSELGGPEVAEQRAH